MAETREYASFEDVRARLDEIVEAVNAEGVSLDDALALYEEAVKLGLSACDLSEQDIEGAQSSDQAALSSAADTPGGSDEQPNS